MSKNSLVKWLPLGGGTGSLRFVVREPARRSPTASEPARAAFHLFVVRDDLEEFSHLHPVPQPDGSSTLTGVAAIGVISTVRRLCRPAEPQRSRPFSGQVGAAFSGSRMRTWLGLERQTACGLRVRIDPDSGT